ncbi:hypothetical protein BS47DRAFT_1377072 [Hydnum rufescens UP504]|uniref:Uncharacterized protein n=1 Tax=Hydnum rufescens UP504 TaxID=1448309 RepID=A0A9P6AU02_9AGAM|nr:hypothetical protein BS47DRAFT_1377072 [Hydnum rufescens UP504]
MKADCQIVLVLCGLVGSGKSTFAQALELHDPNFVRCNQDELGDRRAVEYAVRDALSRGHSVVVDRTNIDIRQRRTWLNITYEFPGVESWVVMMDTPYEECASRLMIRTAHPTLPREKALSVLSRFSFEFVAPQSWEGFDRMFTLAPHPTPTYSSTEIGEILTEIHKSEKLTEPSARTPHHSW